MGRLEVIVGPMYSGKSEELLRRLRRAEIGGYRVACVKKDIDNRYDEKKVVSHAGSFREAITVSNAADIKLQTVGYSIVGVDEVQFFDDEDFVDTITGMARRQIVICSGLDQTYRGEPFGYVPTLLALADRIDKLAAVCHVCGEDATKTQRLIDGKPAPFTGSTIQIGGYDTYEARCREHWREG